MICQEHIHVMPADRGYTCDECRIHEAEVCCDSLWLCLGCFSGGWVFFLYTSEGMLNSLIEVWK